MWPLSLNAASFLQQEWSEYNRREVRERERATERERGRRERIQLREVEAGEERAAGWETIVGIQSCTQDLSLSGYFRSVCLCLQGRKEEEQDKATTSNGRESDVIMRQDKVFK
ncbi:hypothetical protein WMY93_028506 [Mugilogobius chulae]|uniref:Uncharacterized protein n=1 Tax=Mugilogobius chulae TaxID=88201 RepID=A0AAW0MYX1_9GOBI